MQLSSSFSAQVSVKYPSTRAISDSVVDLGASGADGILYSIILDNIVSADYFLDVQFDLDSALIVAGVYHVHVERFGLNDCSRLAMHLNLPHRRLRCLAPLPKQRPLHLQLLSQLALAYPKLPWLVSVSALTSELFKPLPGSGRLPGTSRVYGREHGSFEKNGNDIELSSNRYEDMVPRTQPRTMV
ncbi:hypothetical protein RJ55_01635 [Drechmeria coniospora]|nr:hypothetical protein RJ55_01635 [Drechmeria coniospora]